MRSKYSCLILSFTILSLIADLSRPSMGENAVLSFTGVDSSWVVTRTPHRFPELTSRLEEAIKSNEMNMVNVASASEGAKAQGIAIPGNRVVGVFRNDFARRMLSASIPAGIEAPIRIYLVEQEDGRTVLAYRRPTKVFAPYLGSAGEELARVANELDVIFEKIASTAAAP